MRIMRTTVNIQDEALELGKAEARDRGVSLGDIISEAIFSAYRDRIERARARPEVPAGGRGGLCPGVDLDDSTRLEDVMDGRV